MISSHRPRSHYLASEDGKAALRSLTVLERIACKRSIERQFAYWVKIPKIVDDGGLEAAVRICSARAMYVYVLLVGIIATTFAIAGMAVVAVPVWGLVFLLLALGIARALSAVPSRRRWRNSRHEATDGNEERR
jgi:uncharacterized protein (DUF983 family)